jgi:hypothetical protein
MGKYLTAQQLAKNCSIDSIGNELAVESKQFTLSMLDPWYPQSPVTLYPIKLSHVINVIALSISLFVFLIPYLWCMIPIVMLDNGWTNS